jgi:hypothetical protein
MLGLHNLQNAFGMAMTLDDNQSVTSSIKTGDDLAVSIRLNIYRNNITSALIRGLEGLYPVLQVLLGAENFTQLAKQYISNYPPTTGHVLDYGQDMPIFIAGQESLKTYPFLQDVAQLEWYWNESYGATDAEVLNPETLAAVSPQSIVNYSMTLHPSAHFMKSEFPVSEIWSSISNAEESEEEIALPSIDAGPEWLMIVRPLYEVEVRQLSAPEYDFLQQLNTDQTIAQAYSHAACIDNEFDLSHVLASHLSSGTFTACSNLDDITHKN